MSVRTAFVHKCFQMMPRGPVFIKDRGGWMDRDRERDLACGHLKLTLQRETADHSHSFTAFTSSSANALSSSGSALFRTALQQSRCPSKYIQIFLKTYFKIRFPVHTNSVPSSRRKRSHDHTGAVMSRQKLFRQNLKNSIREGDMQKNTNMTK